MCSVLSEDSLRDTEFIGCEVKPRVIVPLYSCDNDRKNGLHKSRILVLAIVPASDEFHNFCRLRWAVPIFRCESEDDRYKCVRIDHEVDGIGTDVNSLAIDLIW